MPHVSRRCLALRRSLTQTHAKDFSFKTACVFFWVIADLLCVRLAGSNSEWMTGFFFGFRALLFCMGGEFEVSSNKPLEEK